MSNLFVIATIFLCSGFAVSQVSFPQCSDASLDWSFNSIGQNPCEVAAYLQSTCWQGTFTVPALPPGYEYSGPSGNGDDDLCKCNTVTYSLLCACDSCQGSAWISWSEWVANCSNTLPPSTFPNAVPNGIYVPYWSTLDITLGNNWDPNNAMSAGDSPEIGPGQLIGGTGSSPTQTPAGTPTQAPPSTGFPATTTAKTEPNESGPTSSSLPSGALSSKGNSSKTGPIVAGAVGGVALIGIVTLVFVYLRRRRRPANSPYGVPSDAFPSPAPLIYQSDVQAPNVDRRAMSEEGTVASSSLPPASPVTPPPMRVYDPLDPTTYPDLQAAQYAPNIAPQVIFGASRSTVSTHPPVPQYYSMPTGPARPVPQDSSLGRSPRT